MIRPAHATLLLALLASGCAAVAPREAPATASGAAATEDMPRAAALPAAVPPGGAPGRVAPEVTPFSSAALEQVPPAWKPFRLARHKKLTAYRLVPQEGAVALEAVADHSASGLRHEVSVDLHEFPWLTWKWKVPAINPLANNSLAHVEDSPARVVVVFEGGRERLPPAEQLNYDLALAMTGNELPYATLMYIWENHLPEGAVIPHHFSTRVKMIVAGSGHKDIGDWHEERVNLLEDYRRAFGEEPPRVKAVGIVSDSDNTGARTVAYYGDLHFQRH